MQQSRPIWRLALVATVVGAAAACGSAEHGPKITQAGGSAGTSAGHSGASSSSGGQPGGGGGQAAQAGSLSKAGNGTGGALAGGPATAGTASAEGGVSGTPSITDAGAGGEAQSGAGAPAVCSQACKKEVSTGIFCKADESQWWCPTTGEEQLFLGQCQSGASNAIRFCCPPEFMAGCR